MSRCISAAMDRAERNELVEKNIGLVHACANKFRGKGAEYDDLFQAGCVGIIKAAENFDPERGFSFSTYAVPNSAGTDSLDVRIWLDSFKYNVERMTGRLISPYCRMVRLCIMR